MIKAVFALGVPSDFHKHGLFAFGKDNDLPWKKVPQDFALFREKTMGCVCVMGAKTFQSLPAKLPGRINIVIGDSSRECRNQRGETPDMMLDHRTDWMLTIGSEYPTKDIAIIGGLNFILDNLYRCDEVHINFLMLRDEYDMINPTIDISDAALKKYLEHRLMETTIYDINLEHCHQIKVGIWK